MWCGMLGAVARRSIPSCSLRFLRQLFMMFFFLFFSLIKLFRIWYSVSLQQVIFFFHRPSLFEDKYDCICIHIKRTNYLKNVIYSYDTNDRLHEIKYPLKAVSAFLIETLTFSSEEETIFTHQSQNWIPYFYYRFFQLWNELSFLNHVSSFYRYWIPIEWLGAAVFKRSSVLETLFPPF